MHFWINPLERPPVFSSEITAKDLGASVGLQVGDQYPTPDSSGVGDAVQAAAKARAEYDPRMGEATTNSPDFALGVMRGIEQASLNRKSGAL